MHHRLFGWLLPETTQSFVMRHNFRNLNTWKLSMDMVDNVYAFVLSLPSDERYGLRSQMTRCAVSVPSNIAEGSAKRSNKDFIRFLGMALGSAYELETQLLICERQHLGNTTGRDDLIFRIQEIQRMITSFQNHLAQKA